MAGRARLAGTQPIRVSLAPCCQLGLKSRASVGGNAGGARKSAPASGREWPGPGYRLGCFRRLLCGGLGRTSTRRRPRPRGSGLLPGCFFLSCFLLSRLLSRLFFGRLAGCGPRRRLASGRFLRRFARRGFPDGFLRLPACGGLACGFPACGFPCLCHVTSCEDVDRAAPGCAATRVAAARPPPFRPAPRHRRAARKPQCKAAQALLTTSR
jgi:hypothetical protein